MAFKLLISGESNSGKTSLTKNLENSLVISHDGKKYPFQIPHATISDFTTADELIAFVEEKALAYKEKFGSLPDTIVFDSVSRIYETMDHSCNKRFTGFKVYSELNLDIGRFADFLEQLVSNGVNVIIISHAIYDADAGKFVLVGKGSFNKLGGFLSVVDNGIFLETKNGKRIIHYRSTKFPARTLLEDLPDSVPLDQFELQTHLEQLAKTSADASEFEL